MRAVATDDSPGHIFGILTLEIDVFRIELPWISPVIFTPDFLPIWPSTQIVL